MLNVLRQQAKNLHWILWLIIASFVVFIVVQWGAGGGGGRTRESQWAARVGQRTVLADDFFEAFRRQEDYYRQLFGAQYDRSRFMNAEAVLDSLIDRELLLAEADRLGMTVSAEEVAEEIREAPAFQAAGGGFDRAAYDSVLAGARLTGKQFEERLAQDLLVNKMEAALRGAVRVPTGSVMDEVRKQKETATIEYVLFELAAHVESTAATEDELRAHHAAHADRYDAGPARRIRTYRFLRTDAQASLENEEEMRAYYEQRKTTDYVDTDGQPRPYEAVRDLVSRALYAARAGDAAQAAIERFQEAHASKPDAAAAAQAAGVTVPEPEWVLERDGVPGAPGRSGQVARAFDMVVGTVSEALPVEGGQVVIEVLEARETSPLTFDEARGRVEADLKDERARELARREADAAHAELQAGRTLSDVASGRTVETAGPFHRDEGVGSLGLAPALSKAAFELPEGSVGPVADTPRGPVAFRVTARVTVDPAADPRSLATTRERLEQAAYSRLRRSTLGALRKGLGEAVVVNAEVLRPLQPSPLG
jgi:peptidyl-prolyl cis-trans isomerase D